MAPPPPQPAASGARSSSPGDQDDYYEDDGSTTVATESTPLLGSDAPSSPTLRDGHHHPDGGAGNGGGNVGGVSDSDQLLPQTPGLDAAGPHGIGEAHAAARSQAKLGVARTVCICASVWLLIFLQASNMSGMTMTQSSVARDLSAYEGAMWFTSSYLIAASSLSPLGGRLADVFSPRAMVLPCAFAFALGGLVTSQAQSFAVFIVGRCITGVGAAGIMTLSVILVLALAPVHRRGIFIGLVNLGFTIGLSFGAVVFGAVEPLVGWRALFWVQCPIALVAGLGIYLSIPASLSASAAPTPAVLSDAESDLDEADPLNPGGSLKPTRGGRTLAQKAASIDYAGAASLVLTISLFLYGLSGDSVQAVPLLLSLASLVTFVALETTGIVGDPIIPLAVLSSRGVLLSCLAQLGFMAARWTVLFYAPIFALAVRGLHPAAAGSILIPTNAGFGSGGLLVGWLHIRRAGSFWAPSLIALLLFTASLLTLSFVATETAPWPVFVGVVFLNGFFTGGLLNYTLNHMLHLAPAESHFVATSLLGTFRGFAGSFGSAIGGGVFGRALAAQLADGFRRLDGLPPDGGDLPPDRAGLVKRLIGSPALVYGDRDDGSGLPLLGPAERAVAVGGYVAALRTLFQAAVVLALAMFLVQAATGWSGPADAEQDEEEIREAVAEHDPEMEA